MDKIKVNCNKGAPDSRGFVEEISKQIESQKQKNQSQQKTFKSIFRQKTYEAEYFLETLTPYYFGNTRSFISSKYEKLLEDKILCEHNIALPLLEPGENIFLHDLQREVHINSRIRCTDGSVVYYINDELIDTENSKFSYKEANKALNSFINNEEKIRKLKEKLKKYKNTYKYKHRWFNFKLN